MKSSESVYELRETQFKVDVASMLAAWTFASPRGCNDESHKVVVAGDGYTNCCDRALDRFQIEGAIQAIPALVGEIEQLTAERDAARAEVAELRQVIAGGGRRL